MNGLLNIRAEITTYMVKSYNLPIITTVDLGFRIAKAEYYIEMLKIRSIRLSLFHGVSVVLLEALKASKVLCNSACLQCNFQKGKYTRLNI